MIYFYYLHEFYGTMGNFLEIYNEAPNDIRLQEYQATKLAQRNDIPR